MRKTLKRMLLLLVIGLAVVVAPASPASAHPLGNFTVNTYSGLRVGEGEISVDFLVDMAEIPTLQTRDDVDAAGEDAFARRSCETYAGRLDIRLDGRRLDVGVGASDLSFATGQAGLSTLRVGCTVNAPIGSLDGGEHRVAFASANFTDRAGWREITAVGEGTTLVDSDVPVASISERLALYPDNLLASPLDQRTATLVVRGGGSPAAGGPRRSNASPAAHVGTLGHSAADTGSGARAAPAALAAPAEPVGASVEPRDPAPPARVSPLPRGVDRATQAFTSFVSRQDLTLGFAVVAFGASLGLGAVHAFAPGHGKTVMAAYLVGQRGSFRQAMAVALTVTATHTVGVLALGIAISTSAIVAPERVYPWLGAASGVLVALLGAGFLVRISRPRRQPVVHDHGHRHPDHDPVPVPVPDQGHVRGHVHHHAPVHDHGARRGPVHGDHGGQAHDHDQAHDHGQDDGEVVDSGRDSGPVPDQGHVRGHVHAHGGHAHSHGPVPDQGHVRGHVHSHGGHAHSHGPVGGEQLVTRRGLLAMGFVGGLLPSPSAVVVLLGAVALGRTWFGVLLVVAYGLGMAAALAATGLVLLRARGALDRRVSRLRGNRLLATSTRLLAPATAVFIVAVGIYLTARAAAQI